MPRSTHCSPCGVCSPRPSSPLLGQAAPARAAPSAREKSPEVPSPPSLLQDVPGYATLAQHRQVASCLAVGGCRGTPQTITAFRDLFVIMKFSLLPNPSLAVP